MEDSILVTVKKMLGIPADYTAFDVDVIVLINSTLMTLRQLGVGPDSFTVTGTTETWSNLCQGKDLEAVKAYVYLCVRMIFDPPASSYVMDAMKQQKEEWEWRLREQAEYMPGEIGYWQQISEPAEEQTGPFNIVEG